MKIGVMFNFFAGGRSNYSVIGKEIDKIYSSDQLITGRSTFGEHYLSDAETVSSLPENDFQKDLNKLLISFINREVDMIIGVGGDGFLTHIAGFLLRRNCTIPLMGIAGGTANIGPLIKFTRENLENFSPEDTFLEKMGCIEVTTGQNLIGYAFCDVIFGDSFLGTKDNRTCNFSAASFLEDGSTVEITPGKKITGDNFSLYQNKERRIIRTKDIAQIVVSPLYRKEFYRGKAITGALCLSPYNDYGASIGISDSILVNSDTTVHGSVVIEHFLFSPGEIIRFENFDNNTSVIIDGNVYGIDENSVTLRYIEKGVQSVTLNSHCGFPVNNE